MLRPGWFPGLVGDIAALHARQYAASHGFGAVFEAKVARELGEFLTRPPRTGDFFRAVERGGRALGSIALEDEGAGVAHLRWFIASDASRGQGVGSRLLGEALAFCRARGYRQVQLWTFDGLHAARHLYEKHGFRLASAQRGTQWGKEVDEQLFTLGDA